MYTNIFKTVIQLQHMEKDIFYNMYDVSENNNDWVCCKCINVHGLEQFYKYDS